MSYDLQEVLDPRVITEVYKEEAEANIKNPLLDFFSASPRPISGDRYEFVFRPAVKEPAPHVKRGVPARILQPTSLSDRHVHLLHTFNEVGLSMDCLQMLRQPEDTRLQQKGRDEIQRQLEDLTDRMGLFRATALSKALTEGEIFIREDGQIVETSGEAVFTVDLQVPASHKAQLGGIISTSWDVPTAKILDDLDDIRTQASEENAEEPRHVWAHRDIKRFLRDNNQIVDELGTGSGILNSFLRGEVIEDLGGYTWHFYSGTYQNTSGTNEPFLPRTQVVLTPDLGPWFRAVDGSELLPRVGGALHQNVNEALDDLVEVFGDFAYVKLKDNPAALSLFVGSNFMYSFSNPNAIWMPTVDF